LDPFGSHLATYIPSEDAYFRGGVAAYRGNAVDYTNNSFDNCNFRCGLNDRTTSLDNNGQRLDTRHYEHINKGGASLLVPRDAFMRNVGARWNDKFSGHIWT
jgi:hypothetical protein